MVIFVEPHHDDFLLSAGMCLLTKTKQVDRVITVFSSDGNNRGTRELCESECIDYRELNFPNINWKQPSVKFDADIFYNSLASEIRGCDNIMSVLGIGNYAHYFLRIALTKIATVNQRNNLLLFRDFPHSYDKSKLHGMPFELYSRDFRKVLEVGTEGLFLDKIQLFKKYYSHQKALLWFEKEQFETFVPEEIYELDTKESFWK